MRRMSWRALFLCTAALICSAALALENGYVIHATVSSNPERGKEASVTPETTYISGKRLRYEIRDAVVIVDTKHDEVILVSNARRQYTIIKLERLRQISEGMRKMLEEQLKKLEEQMKDAKPEEKQKLTHALAMLIFINQRFKSVSVKDVGLERVAGYFCRRLQVFGDDKLAAEFWLCGGLKVEVDIDKLMDVALSMTVVPTMVRQMHEAVFGKARGVPLRQELYLPLRMSRKVTKVEVKRLRDELFAPPKGYEKVEFKQLESQLGFK